MIIKNYISILVLLLLCSCKLSEAQFDPQTSMFKWVIEKKVKDNRIKLDLKGPEKRRISGNKPPLLTAS